MANTERGVLQYRDDRDVGLLAGSPVGSNPPTITTPSKLTPNAD
jgi:hypothetical protein